MITARRGQGRREARDFYPEGGKMETHSAWRSAINGVTGNSSEKPTPSRNVLSRGRTCWGFNGENFLGPFLSQGVRPLENISLLRGLLKGSCRERRWRLTPKRVIYNEDFLEAILGVGTEEETLGGILLGVEKFRQKIP